MIAERLASQGLTGRPARSTDEVVTRLLAVQAQDPRGARLAVRARSTGLTAADVDDALNHRRAVVTTLNRGTLHLVAAEDYWWLHRLTTPALTTGNERRLRQEGVGPEQAHRGIDVVAAAVADGPRTRAELRTALDEAGVPTRGQALVHVLLAASLRGLVARGPMADGEQAWVAVDDWLGAPPAPRERDEALALLARRYLAGHGPGDARDLARWAGVTLGDARRGLDGVADELEPAGAGLVDLAQRSPASGLPPPRLLGAFDPLLLGWVSRAAFVGEHRQIVTTNGLFRPFALVDGRAVATWGIAAGVLRITLLEPVAPQALALLERDAADVLRFLELAPTDPVIVGA